MKRYCMLLCAAFVSLGTFAGCGKEDTTTEEPTYGEAVSIKVSLGPADGGLDFTLNENDQISVYDSDGFRIGNLTLEAGGEKGDEGLFVSAGDLILRDGETYTVEYPAKSALRYETLSTWSSDGEQDGDSFGHLARMSRFKGNFVYDSQDVPAVELKTGSTYVRLDIFEPDSDYSSDTDGFVSEVKVDVLDMLSDDRISSSAKVRIAGIRDWNRPVSVWLALSPLQDDYARELVVTVTTSQGKTFRSSVGAETGGYRLACLDTRTIEDLVYQAPILVESQLDVKIADDVRQEVYYGLDAERLWYWNDNMRDELAELGVGDINVRYARVAIDVSYEREEGKKNPACYDVIINMMKAFKSVRPDIEFFATPRPILNSYTNEEKVALFGHVDNTPWSSVPLWVYSFVQDGTKKMSDGTVVPKWKDGTLNMEKMLRYFSDYLNLMHENGLEITYMDLTNEKEYFDPEIFKEFCDKLPSRLDVGVHMPKIIGPSSWDLKTGASWLKRMKPEQVPELGVATVHNTGDLGGTIQDFVSAAHALRSDIPVWNTELHGWMGTVTKDEVLSSKIFWQHIQGGFNSLMTWLFYGPAKGKDHTMLWVNQTTGQHIKSAKYEIFKKTVNHTADGNYLACTFEGNSTDFLVTPFIKGKEISIAVLNTSKKSRVLTFDLSDREIAGGLRITRWNADLPRSGSETSLWPQKSDLFQCAIAAESLYFITLETR